MGVDDGMHAAKLLLGTKGKRLYYREPGEAAYAKAEGSTHPAEEERHPMKVPKRVRDWWLGEPPSVEHTHTLAIFRMGTPPLLSRLRKRLRSAPYRWLLGAIAAGLIGWIVVVLMKGLTGLG